MIEKNTDNPFHILVEWLHKAEKSELNDPNAMTLATVDSKGMPDARMVLLKGINSKKENLVFYTNYNSIKGEQLDVNPVCAIVIHWKTLRRQVRARGKVRKEDRKLSEKYFISRSYDSQISALTSRQSSLLDSREKLLSETLRMKEEYPVHVPLPQNWGGYIIEPTEFEFWCDGAHRLHDRFKLCKNGKNAWSGERLYP